MQLSLKNIKIAKNLSHETTAFTADGYVDGKKAFHVYNDGQGGCNGYYIANGADPAWLDAAHEYARSQPPRTISDTFVADHMEINTYPVDLDVLIDDLLDAYEYEKEVKKILKKIAFVHDRKLWTIKMPPTPENIARFQAKKPDAQFLNGMELGQVVDLMKSMGM